MPSKKKRARRRNRKSMLLPALIVILALVAIALVLMLIYGNPTQPANEAALPFSYTQEPIFVQQGGTVAPLVLGASSTPAPSQQPTPAPTATPVPAATTQADRLTPTARPGDYFLPIYDRALRTADDELMIAITIDNCDDPQAMTRIMQLSYHYDADVTLFPTGEALMTEGMTEGFKTCVYNRGFELENHGFSAKSEFRMSDAELSLHMWKQSIAASYAMGADYQQHFYRPYSKNQAGDQRTHFYARKLGYHGIASYTHGYKGYTIDELIATLDNGDIYQFDMSEESMALLESFMAAANRKGYRMVTLNELFALDENARSSTLTIDRQTLPGMEDYIPSFYDLRLNDRCHAVYDLQEMLIQTGYLTDVKADGIYGAATSIAVSAFQAEVGIPATGNATAETQVLLSERLAN